MSESDPLSQYPAYSLWESDPLKDPDHKARLDCLLDLRWAVEGLTPWAGTIGGGILWILILLLIKIPDGNEFLWGFPFFLFIMGVPGTCYYTHKYRSIALFY